MRECYGWIPTISGNLFLEDKEDLIEKAKDLAEDIKRSDEYQYKISFYNLEIQNSKNGRRHVWEIKIALRGKKEIEKEITCRTERRGICKIETEEETEIGILLAAYRFVRDVYHQHIHHSSDQRLFLVEEKEKVKAIKDIFRQYQRKVIYYHKYAHSFIKTGEYNFAIEELLSPGIGEMNYGKTFVTLFSEELEEDKSDLIQRLNNSINSMRALQNKSNLKIEEERKELEISIKKISYFLTSLVILFGCLSGIDIVFKPDPVITILSSLSIFLILVIFLLNWFPFSKEEKNVPEAIDENLLKKSKNRLKLDPEKKEKIKEYFSMGELKN